MASIVAREASRLAFKEEKYSFTTPYMINCIGKAFEHKFLQNNDI
jgi:hypothetical protein